MVVCAAVGLSLFAVPEAAIAQLSVKVQTDTHQVHIGDPIQLRLRVTPLEPQQQVLFPPDFDDPWPDHVSTSRLVSPSSPPGEAVYDLRLYETGEAELRGLNIDVVDGGDTLSLQTASIRIDVLAVREEGEQDLRMIKPPWAIAGGIPVWLVAMLAALLAVKSVKLFDLNKGAFVVANNALNTFDGKVYSGLLCICHAVSLHHLIRC